LPTEVAAANLANRPSSKPTMPSADPRVDAYIAKAAPFAQPILEHLRAQVHAAVPDVQEAIKWGFPNFLIEGRMLCHMAAFRAHCGFGFWRRDQIETGHEGEALGQFGRIASLEELPEASELRALIAAAAASVDAPATPARTRGATRPRKSAPQPSAHFAEALAAHTEAQAQFKAFAPSQQREYVEWIDEAKTEATRARRIEQALQWLAEGKPRNWKYMRRT
jgi:uncharacterized protein YdeI (YjbR/CyaY-like superfamily)